MIFVLNQPWLFLATAAFAVLISLNVWRQPDRPGTRHFRWMLGIWFVWGIAAALQIVARSQELRYLMWVLQSICALMGIPLQLLFVLVFMGFEKWSTRRSRYLLYLPVSIFAVISIIQPNSLVSIQVQSGIEVLAASSLTRWTFIPFGIILILVTLGVLFASLLRTPAFRLPILLIILAQSLTALGYMVVDPKRLTVSPIHVAILLSNFNMLAYFVALYNFRLLRVIPVAHDAIISHIPYGLIVLDVENYLVDFNPAAQDLPGLPGRLSLRQGGQKALGSWWEHIASLIGPEIVSTDVVIQNGEEAQIFRVRSLPLLQSSGWRIGQAFVMEDVTRSRQVRQQRSQALWAQATLQEREQLANELHDGLSQNLAFLNLQAQAAQVYLQTGQTETAKASLDRLIDAASQIQEDTRELIDHLLSVSMPAENFCVTLRRTLAKFKSQTGTAVRLDLAGGKAAEEFFDPTLLPPPVAVHLIRITQEALANVRKHARSASLIRVRLKASDSQMQLTIADDGDGFDPAAWHHVGKHYGLQVMRQRAARIGGQVEIASAPGKGTRIEVCVPLTNHTPRRNG